MEIITDNFFDAIGKLLIAGIVLIGWRTARSNAKEVQLKTVLWNGFLWCAGIAFFGSLIMGNSTCESGMDPVYGGCEYYADDGYEPTTEQRVGRFTYFFVLLYIPVIFGAIKGNEDKSKIYKNNNS